MAENGTRKDVNSIQERIASGVIEPICKKLSEFCSELTMEQRIKFSTLIADINNKFTTQCMTEYQLLNYLKQNNLYRDSEEFIIHSQVEIVHAKGDPFEPTLDNTNVIANVIVENVANVQQDIVYVYIHPMDESIQMPPGFLFDTDFPYSYPDAAKDLRNLLAIWRCTVLYADFMRHQLTVPERARQIKQPTNARIPHHSKCTFWPENVTGGEMEQLETNERCGAAAGAKFAGAEFANASTTSPAYS